MTQESNKGMEVLPRDSAKIKKIWMTALILLVVTAFEFVLAFTMERGILLYVLFILLTIVKAKYIMMEFMHLGHEVKPLFYSIVVPLIFLVWLIIALMKEGADILMMRWY
ncbi:cytochrome C oxidase subunit IV family protein [Negadavirga shengliensis]|uniref:Cytochrome C oxidase subunit IV family protein n=1 Tax=Negadavirga shengliensis TaxID=1389218 RepID=A0ABV9SUW7_9BACT